MLKCPECGNDGSVDGLYVAVDLRFDAETQKFEIRELHDGGLIDCLSCDLCFEVPDDIDPIKDITT